MNSNMNWILPVVTFLPLVGALVMMAIPKLSDSMSKTIALATSTATFVLGIVTLVNFNRAAAGTFQFVVDKSWIDLIGSRFIMAMDGLSLPMFLLTVLVVPLVIVYSLDHIPDPGNARAFLALILVLETGMIGSFVAQDLILFFVFFEVVLLPMYFMIGVWGGPERQYASIKFFLYTLFGSALMILSFLSLYFLIKAPSGDALAQLRALGSHFANVNAGDVLHSFDMRALRLSGSTIAHASQLVIFGGMFIGFGIKVPMFPFHTWLPDAHTQAPTQGSVILAAVLLKLGTYGFVRIAINILPEAGKSWAPVIGILACVGIIYGALGCLAQTDMKRLIAFSSVAHMGYVMLGISTMTKHGINAAMFGMVAHGLITGMLFFVAGSVKERYHTLEIKRLGGLLVQAPKMGWILGFATMASLGLPGLAGFWGEFPAILAAYKPAPGISVELFRVLMVVAALGTVLAAGYLLWLFQRTAFGKPSEEFENDPHIHDINKFEVMAWTPLLALIVVFGIAPGLMFDLTDKALVAMGLGA